MSTEFDINAVMKRWRIGVKKKMRGIANFGERAEMRFGLMEELRYTARVKLDDWEFRQGEFVALDTYEFDHDWRPIRLGEYWGGQGKTGFFRRKVEMPREFDGKHVILRMYVGGDGLLRIDGKPYHALDPFHNEIFMGRQVEGGRVYDMEVESFMAYHAERPDSHPFAVSELVVVDDEVTQAYWDFKVALKALEIINIDPKLERFLIARIWDALKQVPLKREDVPDARQAILDAARQLRETLYATEAFKGEGLMHLVAHSHLDVTFMWPYREFVRKVARTHATMLRLMEQYPEFRFAQSQAKTYADMKKYFPELYEQVKKRIAEGRWEVIGAFWVEPDCNLISGESFVRQILYGQKFIEEEFGFRSRTCWQPDVFGNSWGMPQILARSGIEYFLTNKMMVWNDTNPWRHNTFWWQGPDGSRVLGIVPPGHFIGTVDPDIMDKQWRDFSDSETIGETLHVYGWGDGGGGPDAEMIESGRRYGNFPGLVPTKFSDVEEAFDRIKQKALQTDLPVLRDELYLEAHRGTYTNKGRLKKLNRRAELLYRDAEMFAALAQLAGADYPYAALLDGWQELLTTQFHDSLPGTHVNEVYHDLLRDHAYVDSVGREVLAQALTTLVPGWGEAGKQVAVVNTLPAPRRGVQALPADVLTGMNPADSEGAPLPTQRTTDFDGNDVMLVDLPDTPALGWRALGLTDATVDKPCDLQVGDDFIENPFLRARFSPAGELLSLYDKEHQREVLPAGAVGNQFRIFEDTPGKYDAWDLVVTYRDHELDLVEQGTLKVDERGPLRVSLLLEKPIGSSSLRQRISLAKGSRQLTFETWIDWKERQRVLKVGFPVDVVTREATCDMPFGVITRATHENTPYDAARFEVCAHQWVDMSQGDYGVSLLNDCKYGHEFGEKLMRLTLLKGSVYPDPEADLEEHTFTYALYPHAGTWREADTIGQAAALNNPLRVAPIGQAPQQATQQWIDLQADGVALEAVKRAEDGDGLIVRLVERLGGHACGTLTLQQPIQQAWSCDLMENNEQELDIADGAVGFAVKPYEILTLRLRA